MRPWIFAALSLAACSSDPSPVPADAARDAPLADASADGTEDAAAGATLQVATRTGPVIGHVEAGVTSFLGVPYAAPPVGRLRWRAPEPHPAWTTPRDAGAKGATCMQTRGMLSGSGPMSEDCLFLNVWTPRTATGDTARRPVMVFVHGGGFTGGTTGGRDYDGESLAAKGVVVVTFNYRLAQMGFLAHPALSAEDAATRASGNYGFMDQQAALRWVRDNIEAFGGDPAKVTLFGESAGSISVCAHMVAPASAGLFHRAIGQSGPCSFLATPLRETPSLPGFESAEALGGRFAAALGCSGTSEAIATCMRAAPAERVIAAAPTPVELTRTGARYQPNVDGAVFRELPWVSFVAGRFARVPFLSGTNRDEGTVFTLGVNLPDVAAYTAAVRALLPDHVDDVLRLYPAAMYATPKAAFEAFVADAVFVCPARAQARLVAATGTPTFLYHFTRLNRAGQVTGLGVYHSAEIPYVFGNFTGFFTRGIEDEPAVRAMQSAWTRFADTGDPNGGDAPAWPRFTRDGDAHLEIGDAVTPGTGLHRARCDAMESWIAPPSMP